MTWTTGPKPGWREIKPMRTIRRKVIRIRKRKKRRRKRRTRRTETATRKKIKKKKKRKRKRRKKKTNKKRKRKSLIPRKILAILQKRLNGIPVRCPKSKPDRKYRRA